MSATNRGAIRVESDFYPTPQAAFTPLLPHLAKNLQGPVWEPASGDGRLIRWMQEFGIEADGDDLNNGYDFLTDETWRPVILTNPPFSIAFEFAKHAVANAREVYLLLRLNFLGSLKRSTWFEQHEPSALFVLTQRPSFVNGGTDATDYAWFHWGTQHTGIKHLLPPEHSRQSSRGPSLEKPKTQGNL